MHPKISVIVPVYNTEKYLKKCLDSLLSQTLKNIEIICIDDASTDNSLEILEEYAQKDKRLKIIKQTVNQGQSCARNRALKAATAQFIMFCDSDDYYNHDTCQEMFNLITRKRVDIVESAVDITYESMNQLQQDDKRIYQLKYHGLCDVTEDMIFTTSCMTPTKIFKKRLIERYNITFPEHLKYEDAYFTRAYLSVCKKAFFTKRIFYHYVRHQNSTISITWNKDSREDYGIDHIKVISQLYFFWKKHQILDKWMNLFWRLFYLYLQLALDSCKTQNTQQSAYLFAEAFVVNQYSDMKKIRNEVRDSIIRQFPFVYFKF